MTGKRTPVMIYVMLASLMGLSLVEATTASIDTPIVLSDSELDVLGKDSMKFKCNPSCIKNTGGTSTCYPPPGFSGCSASGSVCGEARYNPQSFSQCANDPMGPLDSCENNQGQEACYSTVNCVCDWNWLTWSYDCHTQGAPQDGDFEYRSADCS
ncbi:hypothetical protein Sinac_6264 [Singulisphaera acidiphila DSM 18658]|uniref:Uncharacterized protein n=1 Tax=Singulisphaera acidiphila (strain ATCC BAA-1392 / DSM 18658 / VKM B-2454 / MOB10) TaxID=886293 RepID=L0DND5_SINAD|nr:hypothetical protein Sinac_6264 [Singulisphaera acidiphila DSM 18658]